MSSFSQNLIRIESEYNNADVSDYHLIRSRLMKIEKEFFRALRFSSSLVMRRGRKSAVRKFNKKK